MNICCVQEAKWKGENPREISEGYIIIIYSRMTSTRNGVRVILDKALKGKVIG